jgi:hypothetical protein
MGADPQPTVLAPSQPEPGFSAGPRRRRRPAVFLIVALAVVAAGAAVGAFLFLRSGTNATPTPGNHTSIPPSKPTPRVPFAFQVDRLRTVTLSHRPAKPRATAAANAIAAQLSAFYDTAFADPASWKGGVPGSAWNVFASGVRDRAERDAASFTPATKGVVLLAMNVSQSTLVVTVLLDGSNHAQAAFARVTFEGTGQVRGGQKVKVENAVTFYLRPASGTWLIVGYPQASTKVEAGTAAPSPSPGGTGSASPSPGTSP